MLDSLATIADTQTNLTTALYAKLAQAKANYDGLSVGDSSERFELAHVYADLADISLTVAQVEAKAAKLKKTSVTT